MKYHYISSFFYLQSGVFGLLFVNIFFYISKATPMGTQAVLFDVLLHMQAHAHTEP